MSIKCSAVKLRVISEICQLCIDDQGFWKESTIYTDHQIERQPGWNHQICILLSPTSGVSLFFSQTNSIKCQTSTNTIPVRLSFAKAFFFPFLRRKWLLCVGQHALRDWCKTQKCQDTNWDKIRRGLAAFAMASSTPYRWWLKSAKVTSWGW